jgi:hypothetical protein
MGVLGYGMSSVYGAIPAELFQGKHYGSVFGVLSLGASAGAGTGPWVTGVGLVPMADAAPLRREVLARHDTRGIGNAARPDW